METKSITTRDSSLANPVRSESETFLCKICSKCFSNKLSRNRHQLYCRKKQRPGQPILRKSCTPCRSAKTKCDSVFPCCVRCTEKNLNCGYEKTASSGKSAPSGTGSTQTADAATVGSIQLPGSHHDQRDSTAQNDMVARHPLISVDLASLPCEPDQPRSWVLDNDFSSYVTPPDSGYDKGSTSLELSPSASDINFGLCDGLLSANFDFSVLPDVLHFSPESHDTGECMFDSPYLTFRYIDRLYDSISRTSSVMRRQTPFIPTSRGGGSIVGQNFLLQNIRSYPAMLLCSVNPPHFIHNSAIDRGDDSKIVVRDQPQSNHVAVCQAIVQMYETRTAQIGNFIWRTIGAERKRMAEKYSDANEWDVLAMLQALTIFIIIRIFDEDSFMIDFDNELVETMTNIAIKSEKSGFLSTSEVHGYRPQWHEWILMESKRRTVTILFLIHLLFDISPGQRVKALAGLSALPLPAHKSLWKASTECEWIERYDQILRKREGRRYLSYGDLVFLGKGESGSGDMRIRDLNEWFLGLDEFGILVMMAATAF